MAVNLTQEQIKLLRRLIESYPFQAYEVELREIDNILAANSEKSQLIEQLSKILTRLKELE